VCYVTNQLICGKFYEYIFDTILSNYRIHPKREFYCVSEEEIKTIFDFFNELNIHLDSEDKLLNYIQKYNPEYLNKQKCKKKKGIYIDTSHLYLI
jgi:hypothetical protein